MPRWNLRAAANVGILGWWSCPFGLGFASLTGGDARRSTVLPYLMFIGHFGVGLAAKRLAPRASLGTLFFAAQFLDLIWPIFLLLGLEHVRIVPGITRMSPFDFYDYPISHSLITAVGWSLLVGGIYYVFRRRFVAAGVVGLAVLSHWLLDFLVHRPDLPLWPGGRRVGLGLWNNWVAEITLEVAIFAAGIWIYRGVTRTRDGIGRYAFWSLIALLFFGWVSTLTGAPPPDTRSMAWFALIMWIFVLWAWWADMHREAIL